MKPNKEYVEWIKLIFGSDFAREWRKEEAETHDEEVEFYGREPTELELKQFLIDNFFEQKLGDIVKVLPDLWTQIQDTIRDELEDDVLISPEALEDSISIRGSFHSYVTVDFSLDEHLGDLQRDLTKTLKLMEQEKARG